MGMNSSSKDAVNRRLSVFKAKFHFDDWWRKNGVEPEVARAVLNSRQSSRRALRALRYFRDKFRRRKHEISNI